MDKKKLAAAMAAVFTYIKTCEEAAFSASQTQNTKVLAYEPQVVPNDNAWGISGRGNQMQVNSMMQMRMFK